MNDNYRTFLRRGFSRRCPAKNHHGRPVFWLAMLLGAPLVLSLSGAISTAQSSGGNAPQSAQALGSSALDTILADLKQEISAGSTTLSGSFAGTLSIPTAPATAVPALSGSQSVNFPDNVLKQSAYGQPFYSGTNYDVATYPAADRAADLSTTSLSQNERFVSPARWNKPLLLPKEHSASDLDLTPVMSGSKAFTAPNWILTARDGSNPKTWSSDLINSDTNPGAVTGRYAYTIYDEGGLLDANSAGYPSTASPEQIAYKSSLACADLMQLTDETGHPLLTQGQIDSLIAWRSAHPFSTRQSLIDYATQTLAITGSDRAKLQNALQYFSTFGRSLDQPSYVPPANRPLILSGTAGGNNAYGLDNEINPNFLTARAMSSFTRNDGSTAAVGDPVVNKRFALSRLAWLTCKGPSVARATSSDADIVALKNAGFTTEWLQQGTAANIEKYFGLQWIDSTNGSTPPNYWQYVHGRNGSSGAIMRLNSPANTIDVARSGREADFFELLKATINAGSLAKVGSSVPDPNQTKCIPSLRDQYYIDENLDYAIIQIGANIIDQFDSDNFPTRIQFDDGANSPTMFCGIENLPYLYRVHPAVVKVVPPHVASDPDPTGSGTNSIYYGLGDTLSSSQTVVDTGLGATILIPELWNPNDWCGDNATQAQLAQTLGTMGPQSFEIFAQSDAPVVVKPTHYLSPYPVSQPLVDTDFYNGDSSISPGYITTAHNFSWSGNPITISESTSKMTFSVPRNAIGAQLFREPTALFQKNKPTGSSLSAPGLRAIPSPHQGVLDSNGTLLAAVGNTDPSISGPPTVGQEYIGMYLGTIPLIWRTQPVPTVPPTPPPVAGTVYRANTVILDDQLGPGVLFTFNLQCRDAFGRLVTYDQKQVSIGHSGESYGRIARPMHAPWAGLLQPRRTGDRVYFALDPRTSRFGVQNTGPETVDNNTTQLQWSFPPFSNDHLAANMGRIPLEMSWLSRSEGIMGSMRNGWGIGAANIAIANDPTWRGGLNPYNFPSTMGFYPGGWTSTNAGYACRPGLFAENDAAPVYNDNIAGDTQHYAGNAAGTQLYNASQYYADPDGVVRRGMGGWTDSRTDFIGPSDLSAFDAWFAGIMGLPQRVAHAVGPDNLLHKSDLFLNYPPSTRTGLLLQAEARPMILNRPFRSVAELGYTFAGTPWKNLNMDMPESGDAALLDTFCIDDTADANGLVSGKVNLNTRQQPVLKAILAGAYKDAWDPTSHKVSSTFADLLASRLVKRTSGTSASEVNVSGSGARPLQNLSELVGKWVSGKGVGLNNPADTSVAPFGPKSYDGYSADLVSPLYFNAWTNKTPNADLSDDPNNPYDIVRDKTISRRRAAPIRALANVGQTRVWNLMIDLIAQSGEYPASAGSLADFVVEGEQRYWMHVAIDRYTGEVIAQSIEAVSEPVMDLTNTVVGENQPAGTSVGTFGVSGSSSSATYTYELVEGDGSDGNSSFTLSGSELRTSAVFQYLTQSSYNIRVRATDALGASSEQQFSIAVSPGLLTKWKLTTFADKASDPAIGGDGADPDKDGMSNLVEYALGKSPAAADTPGISIQRADGVLRMNYSKRSLATDIAEHAQWTTNLADPASWSSTGVTEMLLSDDGITQQWQATVPDSSGTSVFMRLIISRP